MRFHVRSLPPLSSGSSRSDFSQSMRMGKRLNPFLIDERSVPELEVEEAPEAISAVGVTQSVIAQQPIDRMDLNKPAFTGAAIEEDLARDAVPAAFHPFGERHRKTHLRPIENRVGKQTLHRFA